MMVMMMMMRISCTRNHLKTGSEVLCGLSSFREQEREFLHLLPNAQERKVSEEILNRIFLKP